MSDVTPPALDYAAPRVDRGRAMRLWRSVCGACWWAAVAGFVWWPPLMVGAGAAAVVAGGLAVAYMGRMAWAEVDGWYAARHVALAVMLSPVALLGVWVVPMLVEMDRWRQAVGRDDV